MYGQTNCWVLPDGDYVAVHIDDHQIFIMSERSARNLAYQDVITPLGRVDVLARFTGSEIIGAAVNVSFSFAFPFPPFLPSPYFPFIYFFSFIFLHFPSFFYPVWLFSPSFFFSFSFLSLFCLLLSFLALILFPGSSLGLFEGLRLAHDDDSHG